MQRDRLQFAKASWPSYTARARDESGVLADSRPIIFPNRVTHASQEKKIYVLGTPRSITPTKARFQNVLSEAKTMRLYGEC